MIKLATDSRFKQAVTEAKWSIALTFGYFFFWIITAYCIPSQLLLWSIPLWFISACIFTPIGFVIFCAYVVSTRFCNMKLDNNNES